MLPYSRILDGTILETFAIFNIRIMFNNLRYLTYLKYSLGAALAYSIPLFIFIYRATYTDAWILYVGNALFLSVMVLYMIYFNRQRRDNASSVSMVIAGHVIAAIGVVLCCLIGFILLTIFVPGLFSPEKAGRVLTDEPEMMVRGNTNGLVFMVIMNAIVGNISMGSFATIIFGFTTQRDQTKESTGRKEQTI
jgi:hypothetical protein